MNIAQQYSEERKRLELNRSLDWSSYGVEFIAAGEPLREMTVQTWFDLLVLKSPIIGAGDVTIDSVIDYIWKNSKRYTYSAALKEWRLFWITQRVKRALNKDESAGKLMHVIFEHARIAFDEYPSAQSGGNSRKSNAMPSVSGEAQMVDELAHRYGINPMDILQMPLRRAFALQRTIRMSTIPEYKLLEPESLRAIKSKFLEQKNEPQ